MTVKPTVLFLQGHPSLFASCVADEIARCGGRALRVNLCLGDRLFWRAGGAIDYRGRLDDWPAFLRELITRESVSDVVYYADRTPYHRAAAVVARQLGVRATTYEFGYLRPDWITLERGGMSAWSHFPRDPQAIRDIAASVGEPDVLERFGYAFGDEAMCEVTYNLVSLIGRPLYPHYVADKYYHPLLDYLSYVPRLIAGPLAEQRARRLVAWLLAERMPFYLCPMQMQNDYQLRANSPYRHQSEMLEEVIGSFAAKAPPEAHLVLKVHPLDNGLEGWPRIVRKLARTHGAGDRVHLVQGGDLRTLLTASRGVVVVNSTVGVHALRHGRPVKVLGAAMYDIDGLTHQGPLDTFWQSARPPDPALCADFVRAIAATIHVKGNFFTAAGRAEAVPAFAARLMEGRVNQPGAFVDPPPRLMRALALGVPFSLDEATLAAGTAPADVDRATPPALPEDERVVTMPLWRRVRR